MSMERNLLSQGAPPSEAEQLRFRRAFLPAIHEAAVVSASWGRRDRLVRRGLAAADAIGLLAALAIALALGANPFRVDHLDPLLLMAATLPLWLVLFKLYGLYDRDIKRISHSSIDDLPWLFHALLLGGLGFWGLLRITPEPQLTLLESFLFGVSAIVLIIGLRSAARRALARWMGPERMLFAGTGPLVPSLVRKIEQHPEYGLEPVGLLEQPEGDGTPGHCEDVALPVLGGPSELEQVIARSTPDRVLICRSEFTSEQVMSMIDTCRRFSVKVSILPDALESLGPSVEVDEVEGVTLLGVNPPVLSRTSRLMKRGFDLSLAVAVLILTAPLMALTALAIRLDSPGPVFFRQARIGRAGHPFEVLKFRTMVVDAEAQRETLMEQSADPSWLHLPADPRVTRLGRLLRRSSLDELPQLWNVVLGEMSLVGPRPLPACEDANVGGWARGRLDLTPGITGMWQVLGRTRIPFDEMVKLDYMYVTNWSLWMDLRILLRTMPVVFGRRGVN